MRHSTDTGAAPAKIGRVRSVTQTQGKTEAHLVAVSPAEILRAVVGTELNLAVDATVALCANAFVITACARGTNAVSWAGVDVEGSIEAQ